GNPNLKMGANNPQKASVGAARTSLRDAARSLLPRSGTASSVTIVDIAVSRKVCDLLTLCFPTTERRSHWSQLRETESRYINRGEPNELD
ncbi:MAG: hypothetical protein ACYTXY_24915, partial [Nostoc sp.]